ncbi:2260_t:CDS:2 [Paraglomus occultum]|uniref:2260_t:CDS:1 n=1 Tax=Paraglomus occultum TaxID=144539 RepID=A0A9N9GBD8_9GLOM|nr:2260_t:CDS:2 [Paraglomus occultum]
MSSGLAGKIFDFLITSPLEHITAFSVVYQAMEEDPWIERNNLRNIVNNAISLAKNEYSQEAQNKLLTVSLQFDIAFEGVCSLRDIETAKEIEEISKEQIKKNMRELKGKLRGKSSPFLVELYNFLDYVDVDSLRWQDPFASQVISDESSFVRNLPGNIYHNFMEPSRRMKMEAPPNIREMSNAFVEDFYKDEIEIPPPKYSHNHTWRETKEKLADISTEILESLSDIWRNSAFDPKFAKAQSEGTYVTDVIVPLLRVSLKKLPIRNTAFLSTAERQSQASADRKGEGKQGKRPDIMFIEERKDDDEVKLWREMNDGLYWVYSGSRPNKNEFGIAGVQIAGDMFHFNIIIKDMDDIHRLYHLYSVKIPIRPTGSSTVSSDKEDN